MIFSGFSITVSIILSDVLQISFVFLIISLKSLLLILIFSKVFENNLGVLYYEQGKYKIAEIYAKMAYDNGVEEAKNLLDEIIMKKK